jgi:hypothetical protein
MAEVRINIKAEDNASGVFRALDRGVEAMRAGASGLSEAFRDVESRTIAASSGALEFGGRIASARLAVAGLGQELQGLDLARSFVLDVSGALRGAEALRVAIEAIPDVTRKTVILEYKTMASPVRPFSEGMEHIRRMMESLPSESSAAVSPGDARASN